MARTRFLTTALIGLLMLAGTTSLFLAGCGGEFGVDLPVSAASAGEFSFELTGKLSEADNTATVYRVTPPDVTVDKVIEMGRKLGFAGDARFIDDGSQISMVDETGEDTRQFIVWVNSGTLEYHVMGPPGGDKLFPPVPPTLPSDEEAGRIAIRFLADAGLLPAGAGVRKVGLGGGCGGAAGEYVAHLLVSITHEIDGVPTVGPGGKFGVRIGDEGEVVAFYRVWREVEPYTEVSVKSPYAAYQDLLDGRGSCLAPSKCKKAVVESVHLAYWMEAADEKQEYVVPVYEFKGKCLGKDGQYLEDFTAWCEAVR